MINASNIVCLKILLKPAYVHLFGITLKIFIYLFKPANIMFLSYILFELLDDEHGTPISQKKCKM